MKILIETIPHAEHRYETVGDWQFEASGDLIVRVSDMGNAEYESLVAIHEIVEALLCKKRGISEKEVTAFDEQFEIARKQFPDLFGDNEPGDHPKAPYNAEHAFATRLEHSLSLELGVDWQEYTKAVSGL
jgi:hypothetical protein